MANSCVLRNYGGYSWLDTKMGREISRTEGGRRKAGVAAVTLALLLLAFSSGHAAASARPVRRTVQLAVGPGPTFHLPSGTVARSVAVAPDGTIWFTGRYWLPDGNLPPIRREREALGRLTLRGRLTYFLLPRGRTFSTSGHALVFGPEGDLWFGEGDAIGRLSPNGRLSRFTIGRRPPEVRSMTIGPDGNLWFTAGTEGGAATRGAIGRITPSGSVTRFPLGGEELPGQIVGGPDGALWFTSRNATEGAVGRITTSGEATLIRLPGLYPRSIAIGWDERLWVAGIPGGVLGRVGPKGEVDMLPVPGSAETGSIVSGPDGDIWFTTDRAVDSITPAGAAGTPTCLAACKEEPLALAISPDGSLVYASALTMDDRGGGGSNQASGEAALRRGGMIGTFHPAPTTIAGG